MNVTLVRHATLLLETSLGRILVDPMLRAAGTTPPIDNTPNQRPNPLVELPLHPEKVVAGVDLCIVTHLHSDHFDDAADEVLPRDVPIAGVHLEAINHCIEPRSAYRRIADVQIPADGETIEL